jgi:hypothetical protein
VADALAWLGAPAHHARLRIVKTYLSDLSQSFLDV